ncbi:SDR family NAD(P)-dependent oxidoreductase [Siccirubricoccus phaeus]|uniref:SDR family NAD(P)-dependent oxidoreductase n=1 Tax=Siccirubricoccus phaeus TaxID=2595053 RepID=UPI001F1BE4A3|nr:SDR family NAD(P)-dependent oxidoreductase [Siccirubricoccus phaeus]
MIVLVTGAGAGVGHSIARRFAADGARAIAAGMRRGRRWRHPSRNANGQQVMPVARSDGPHRVHHG